MRRIILVIVGLIVLLPPALAQAAIAFSQQQTNGAGSGSSSIAVTALTISSDNALILCIHTASTTSGITSTVADNNSGVWFEVPGFPERETSSGNNHTADIWYSVGHPAGSTAVTVTFQGGTAGGDANLSTYSGLATTNPLDQHTVNTDSPAGAVVNMQTGTITTVRANELLVGCFGNQQSAAGDTLTDYGSSGGTPTKLTRGGSFGNMDPAYQIVSSTGNYGIQQATSVAGWWVGGIASFTTPQTVNGLVIIGQ